MTENGATGIGKALSVLRNAMAQARQRTEPAVPPEGDLEVATATLDEHLTNALLSAVTLDVVAVATSQPHFIVSVRDRRHTDLVTAAIPQDIDSGRLDAYRVSVGAIPARALNSELGRSIVIYGLLTELGSRGPEQVPRSQLVRAARTQGLHQELVKHELEQLKRRGVVAEVGFDRLTTVLKNPLR